MLFPRRISALPWRSCRSVVPASTRHRRKPRRRRRRWEDHSKSWKKDPGGVLESVFILSMAAAGGALQASPAGLPGPSANPLQVDVEHDPVLLIGRRQTSWTSFRAALAAAIDRNPGLTEYSSGEDEARAG